VPANLGLTGSRAMKPPCRPARQRGMRGGQESLDVLLQRAVTLDPESEERSAIVRELHQRADRPAFEAACMLARSSGLR